MPNESQRLTAAEAWWAFLTRVLAFVIGAVILLYATFAGGVPWYIAGGAFGCLGPIVAGSVAKLYSSLRGGAGD